MSGFHTCPRIRTKILEIKNLDHLKEILLQIFENPQIVSELFGFEDEIRKKANEQSSLVSKDILERWLAKILDHLEDRIVKETDDYVLLHCPFHPPDVHPSFAIYRNTYLGVDFHNNRVYKLSELARALGIKLNKKGREMERNILWIPLDPPMDDQRDDEDDEPAFGWLKIEKIGKKKFLVSIVKENRVVIPAQEVGPTFAFKPSKINYFFGHIREQFGSEKFNEWFGELQEHIRRKMDLFTLNIPSKSLRKGEKARSRGKKEDKESDVPIEEFDLEVLEKQFGLEDEDEVKEIFQKIIDADKEDSLHATIAEFLVSRFTFKTIEDSEEILYYDNGVYKFNGEQKIKELVQKILMAFSLSHLAKKSLIEEVVEYVKRSTYVSIREFYRFDESGLINLKNGVLDPETLELYPHSPDYPFLWQLPVKYDPLAKAPKIERFLREIVAPKDFENLLRVATYPLMPGQPFQVAIFLVGSGSNGKSTFLNLLKAFYGSENISALTLHDLENNRFAPASLVGKLANIAADIPSQPLDKIETFKAITGGDSIQIEKKFKQSYPVPYIRAKLIFSANKLPELSEYNYAALRRFVIIKFPNKFEGSKRNPNLLKELTTEEELSGFLNMVLGAYLRLKKEGFSAESLEETHREWIRWSDPLSAFIREHVESDEGYVLKDDIWDAFYSYCQKNNIPFPYSGKGSKNAFFRQLYRKLKDLGIEVKESRITGENGKRPRVITGIRIVDLEELLSNKGGEDSRGEDVSWQVLNEIVNILSMQDATFEELKQMTAFADSDLAKALNKLVEEELVTKDGKKYHLVDPNKAKNIGFTIVEIITSGKEVSIVG
ncbi:MAG: putative primase/helicase [Thermococcaceae archaeon]|uniref:DNA primase family protein n=1 Tax=Thermococcus sp. PK TaxID=913025 RepID=UPI0005B27AC2|nr:phage/plasmid primase, P4 family [Thermococcus sp. PK]MDK2853190.1 putative primase/helicase [Thermococcaceae archaeon]MDN5319720.1 putative primase/helicase [Thermococcaceae archaeon]HIH73364.1 hypothetical protein [Thermococcaceae archaeon]